MRRNGRQLGRRPRLVSGVVLSGAIAVALLIPSGGSATAQAPPKATGQPRISGTAVEGSRLTSGNGSWSGTGPFNYAYRWLRCPSTGGGGNGEGCVAVSGATFRRSALHHA